MMYFENAKRDSIAAQYPFGPGFVTKDTGTRHHESAQFAEAMNSDIQRGQRAEFVGSFKNLEEYENPVMERVMRIRWLNYWKSN